MCPNRVPLGTIGEDLGQRQGVGLVVFFLSGWASVQWGVQTSTPPAGT